MTTSPDKLKENRIEAGPEARIPFAQITPAKVRPQFDQLGAVHADR